MIKKYADGRNDTELLSLMVDMYKAYRKINKHMQAKESMFSTVLVDAYRVFVSDKVPKLPDNVSVLDLAVKLCTYEMNYRKTQGKQQQATAATTGGAGSNSGPSGAAVPGAANGGNGSKQMLTSGGELPATMIVPMQPISANFIPGLTRQNRRLGGTKTSTASAAPATSSVPTNEQSNVQQHSYPATHQYGQTAMTNMMSDLSSRVTITPIMHDSVSSSMTGSSSSSTKVIASATTSATTVSTTAAKSAPFSTASSTGNELLFPLPSGSSSASLPSVTLPTQTSATSSSATGAVNSSTLYQQYLKLFSQIPNIAAIGNNPMMTAAFTEYLAAFKIQSQKAALSPSTDRSTSTPSPLPPPMSLAGLPKSQLVSSGGKEYNLASTSQQTTAPTASTVLGGNKKASTGTKSSAGALKMDQQLATITLTPMSTLTGNVPLPAKKEGRVSSPFGGTAQRVASPSPILTITPSDGPIPARNKDPPGGRKIKGRKAGTGQQTRPSPYGRPPIATTTIPQLGVPGLSIEPVMGPLMQPLGGKASGSMANTGRTDKTLNTGGMFDAGVPHELLASYMELMQKYPHMARSWLMSMKGGTGGATTSSSVSGPSAQTTTAGGR
uniref:Uncharacterized protein n=1 Tax=Anopheles maculatus TaxID=74869 RepID=A0A182SN64_9DIPT